MTAEFLVAEIAEQARQADVGRAVARHLLGQPLHDDIFALAVEAHCRFDGLNVVEGLLCGSGFLGKTACGSCPGIEFGQCRQKPSGVVGVWMAPEGDINAEAYERLAERLRGQGFWMAPAGQVLPEAEAAAPMVAASTGVAAVIGCSRIPSCRVGLRRGSVRESKPALKVTVFSDYICPFCYVGAARLERLREHYDLRVNWCFIEIHPETSPAGEPVAVLNYAADTWQRMMAGLRELAREEVLVYREHDFTTNSHAALQLAEVAKFTDRDVFYRLHTSLFAALFQRGDNIGDRAVLRRLGREAGMSERQVEQGWTDEAAAARMPGVDSLASSQPLPR